MASRRTRGSGHHGHDRDAHGDRCGYIRRGNRRSRRGAHRGDDPAERRLRSTNGDGSPDHRDCRIRTTRAGIVGPRSARQDDTPAGPGAARKASRTKQLLAAAGTVVVVATVAIVLAVANKDDLEPVAATAPATTTSSTSTITATSSTTTTTTTTTTEPTTTEPTTSEAPTTESAAPPPSTEAPSALAAAAGFNGVYRGNEIVTAMSGPFHESMYVGRDFGPVDWTVSTTCAADSCVAAITSSTGRQFSFVTVDGVTWTSEPTDGTDECLDGDGSVIGSRATRIERTLTATAVDQGRVTGIRSAIVINSVTPCEGFTDLSSYSTQTDWALIGGVDPKQAARHREILGSSGAKSDKGDAHALADMIRTRHGQLRELTADSRHRRGGEGCRSCASDPDLGTDSTHAAPAGGAAGVLSRRVGGVVSRSS